MADEPLVVWRVALKTPEAAVAAFEAALEPHCQSLSAMSGDGPKDPWTVEGFCAFEPDRVALDVAIAVAAASMSLAQPKTQIKMVPTRNWLEGNQDAFPPTRIGRYYIHGSHLKGAAPSGCVPLMLDAGMAFGTGGHGTTAGCLAALDRLARRRFFRPLDLGCGSGVLALAMAGTWRRPVVAVDLDPDAVEVAEENARANGLSRLVRVVESDGVGKVRERTPFDLITANILARPLRAMAGDVMAALAPGGVVVLSGFFMRDANRVFSAYHARGARRLFLLNRGDWATLALQKAR